MTLYLDVFGHKFEQAQQRIAKLAQKTEQDTVSKDLLIYTLDELANALEEVHVLSEELSQQHDQLQVAHGSILTERQQYFELFDLAPEGYIVTDTQGIIQHINQTAVTLVARRPQAILGKPLGALVAKADIQRFYTVLNQLQQGKIVQQLDLCLHSYQRLSIDVSFSVAPIQDSQLQLIGFRWLFRDLTQERQATMALQASEAQYRAIVEDQTELICRSLADARITFTNQAFCYYFDCSPTGVMGTSFLDWVAEVDRERVMRQLAALDLDHRIITVEHRVLLPGGELRWQSWVHRALFDPQGAFFQFQSVGRDITERKQTEEALHQSVTQLRLVTDSLPILLTYVNAKQQVMYANRTHEHWLGVASTDIVGQYLWEVIGPEAYRQIRFPLEEALSGDHVTFEREITWPHQPPFWIRATFVPDRTATGQVKGFFGVFHDISDRKAIEQQKDQLIAMVSHELRTPLATIHGALRLLTHGAVDTVDTAQAAQAVDPLSAALSADGQNLLALADRNAEHMVRLIDDLLDFQQIQLDKLSLTPQSCQAADLIQRAMDTLQAMAQKHQVTLETTPCPIPVWADCDRIVQVLTNLISNAIKFSPVGGTVAITAGKAVNARLPPSSPHVRFKVRDQGQGMPADTLERIFEAFQQIDAADPRNRGGAGLGLAICRGIIEQHGGTICAESTRGNGTTVSFTLPHQGYQP